MPIKLNIGPGRGWAEPGWHSLDYYNTEADFICDLRDGPPLPLPTHSVRTVFCSHVIEHLTDEAVRKLFREVFRILEYGGTFRVSCPDAALAVKQYREGNCDPEREVVSRAMRSAPSHLRLLNVLASFRAPVYRGRSSRRRGYYSGGPIESEATVAKHVKRDSLQELGKWAVSLIPDDATYRAHINAHWPKKVVQLLREAGFRSVRVSQFRQSRDPELRGPNFDNRPTISLFVEARAVGRPKRIEQILTCFIRPFRRRIPPPKLPSIPPGPDDPPPSSDLPAPAPPS